MSEDLKLTWPWLSPIKRHRPGWTRLQFQHWQPEHRHGAWERRMVTNPLRGGETLTGCWPPPRGREVISHLLRLELRLRVLHHYRRQARKDVCHPGRQQQLCIVVLHQQPGTGEHLRLLHLLHQHGRAGQSVHHPGRQQQLRTVTSQADSAVFWKKSSKIIWSENWKQTNHSDEYRAWWGTTKEYWS